MEKLNIKDVNNYVENNIGTFHNKRIEKLKELKLKEILKRKNPYLFKAKNLNRAQDIIKVLLDAYLSSQEETIFGKFLEELSIFICNKVNDGSKSSAEGIDLEFTKDEIRYLVSIKSGPNWGNSSQINKMKDNFRKAKKILGTNITNIKVVAINGCCYGRDKKPDKGEYLKICGQRFWEFISNNPTLYLEIIKPLGAKAKQKNEQFKKSYNQVINNFTLEFLNSFCVDGIIDWNKLVKFNSSVN
ncbi:MAG: cytosolic protein [Bacteroidetes bacterium]|nr:cytosolic protein [Bacteroidota bacterium]MBL7105256.1 cytosolic protein [Bacteroidales bacterium]